MAFTQDELQAFNTILEQRLSVHRRELEHTFDQRLSGLRRELEQRLSSFQQDMYRTLTQRLNTQQHQWNEQMKQQHTSWRRDMTQSMERQLEQQRQQFQGTTENALAAQLLAIEELFNQHLSSHYDGEGEHHEHHATDYDTIEVQTEIPWDDIAEVVDKVLERRLSTLHQTFEGWFRDVENYLTMQFHSIREDLQREQASPFSSSAQIHELFQSIEQLGQIVESMQVAMNANHALLSNRLYYHQQLPAERAHPSKRMTTPLHEQTPREQPPSVPLLNSQQEEPQKGSDQQTHEAK
uniref:Uncharacterized protein n=1 Tax=Thermosporothrix sp. COM3 TaxID=2490863 RepID=A0A455SWE0_9CHLR|nr:hypothetical protein KTC_61700 [Thermosporothrix sp. COM3]